jgi:ATP-dependent Clp protease protease subunit
MPGTVYLNFYAEINRTTVGTLISYLQSKIPERPDRIVILISSTGGRVIDGLTAYNFLKGFPSEVIMHNYGAVQSMAVVLFCGGRVRLATRHSRFLIHGLYWIFGSESVPEAKLREHFESLKTDRENMARVIAEASGKRQDDVNSDILAGRNLAADEAKAYGLIHDVQDVQVPPGTEVFHIQG